MAQEEIIIIQESEAADINYEGDEKNGVAIDDERVKKKKILIFGGVAIVLTLVIVLSLLVIIKPSKKNQNASLDFIEDKLEKDKIVKIEPSKLENMIIKANYLYANGSKKEALFCMKKSRNIVRLYHFII